MAPLRGSVRARRRSTYTLGVHVATFGQWQYECDHDATKAACAKVERGGAVACSCNGCRNFVAARERIFSEAFLSFLETVGIDPLKDAEAYHVARLAPGRHDYGGWFHFVGKLTSTGDFPVVDLGSGLTAWLCQPNAPRLSPLERLPVVQVEFHSDAVPWLLDEPEPE